ncbi:MAG: hypothetical protein Q8J68_14820 [Methanolobus sp.]|nr:hypothetical protein [Methanolobus sp.]MDP2218548.1 hypothetical protein [Methanolobus sp.]
MDKIRIELSQEFKDAVKKEFENLTGKVTLILNDGGIRDGYIEIKIK